MAVVWRIQGTSLYTQFAYCCAAVQLGIPLTLLRTEAVSRLLLSSDAQELLIFILLLFPEDGQKSTFLNY